METIRYILELYCDNIARILFTGFALYFLMGTVVSPLIKKYQRFTIYNSSADKIIHYIGMMYIVLFIILSIIQLNIEGEIGEIFRSKMFGSKVVGMVYLLYWVQPIVYSLITIISMISIRYKSVFIFILCIIVMIPIEMVVLVLVNDHGFLPSSHITIERLNNTLFTYGICISLFVLMLEIGYQGHLYKAKKKESTEG